MMVTVICGYYMVIIWLMMVNVGYPLVMNNIAIENHHAIKNGKPSISIRAMASIAMLLHIPHYPT